jgi:hypothetical protein
VARVCWCYLAVDFERGGALERSHSAELITSAMSPAIPISIKQNLMLGLSTSLSGRMIQMDIPNRKTPPQMSGAVGPYRRKC